MPGVALQAPGLPMMADEEPTGDTGGAAMTAGNEPAGRRSANIYVDGFNLYYGALKGTEFRWLDIVKLCHKLVPQNPINRVRYFTARVSARDSDPHGPARQDTYLRALGAVGGISIHMGRFKQSKVRLPVVNQSLNDGRRMAEVYKTEEKGSDVNLATYLLLDAFRGESDIAVVVSNDSDLEEPIRVMIQELDVPVGLVNPHKARPGCHDLIKFGPLFYKVVRPNALRACQLPDSLQDSRGEIRRPSTW
jgi:NYN domain